VFRIYKQSSRNGGCQIKLVRARFKTNNSSCNRLCTVEKSLLLDIADAKNLTSMGEVQGRKIGVY